jgi:multidrug resistance efflux pump
VALGATVTKGQPLLTLACKRQKLALKLARVRQKNLEQQLAAIEVELTVREQALGIAKRVAVITVQQARARYRKVAVTARYARRVARRYRRLWPRGVVRKHEYYGARAKARRLRHERSQVAIDIRRLRQRDRLQRSEWRAELAKLKRSMVRLRGKIAKLQIEQLRLDHEIQRRTIRSPTRGKVVQLARLTPTMFVKRGKRLLTIVPEGQIIASAGFTRAQVVGRIRPGQAAMLQPVGFPLRRSRLQATVTRVASEPQKDGSLRVEFRLETNQAPHAIPIEHGLPARVRVEVDRASPALLLLRAVGRAARNDADNERSASTSKASVEAD